MTTERWRDHFRASVRHTVRPAASARDLSLVSDETGDAMRLSLWDGIALTAIADPGGDITEAVLSHDGAAVIVLRDDTGDEMGHLWRVELDGSEERDLTPHLRNYTLRGLDVARDCDTVVLTAVSDGEFVLWAVEDDTAPHELFRTPHEAWNGLISADGRLASIDTTDLNPSQRRFAVTVVDVQLGHVLATLSDGVDGPVRATRFSPLTGDDRMLVWTEQSGYARPAIWDPRLGDRSTIELPDLTGDVIPLDWSPDGSRLLLVNSERGVQRLYEYSLDAGSLRRLSHPDGAVFQPAIAAQHQFMWASHYGPDGRVRVLHQRYDRPLAILREDDDRFVELLAPPPVPPAVAFSSHVVTSADGTEAQLWVGVPPDVAGPVPMVLEVHGGPNWVTVDHYDPGAQAWLDAGFAFASLNYRGSVTFGRAFREGFIAAPSRRELEDVTAAIDAMVDGGIADPSAVFMMGMSYGGYLTLMGLSMLPDRLAGGFAFVAMADWAAAYEDANPALRAASASLFFGGTPTERPAAYRRASPLSYVDQVRAPVWLRHGTHDSRTPPRQILMYADALHAAGGDVSLEWFTGGHETSTLDQRIAEQATMIGLARRALSGERWNQADVEPSAAGPAHDPPQETA
jgi:dipeptidyl aminopeptidase/acylaminoacyl peptidase